MILYTHFMDTDIPLSHHKVNTMTNEERLMTIEELANEIGVKPSSVRIALRELKATPRKDWNDRRRTVYDASIWKEQILQWLSRYTPRAGGRG